MPTDRKKSSAGKAAKANGGVGSSPPRKKTPSASQGKSSSSSSSSGSNGNGKNGSSNGSSGNGQGNGQEIPIVMGPKPTLDNGLLKSTANPPKEIVRRILGVRTRNYDGPLGRFSRTVVDADQPVFMRYFIPAMLRDPEIWYGVEMLKGPIISKAKYTVTSEDEEVSSFVQRQIERFWIRGISLSLSCLTYGYIGLETVYRFNPRLNCVEFKGFKYIHPNDARPVIRDGYLVGMAVKRIRSTLPTTRALYRDLSSNVDWNAKGAMFLACPKIFWAVHDQKNHRWFGRSRLEGSFIPWYECWQPQGYRSIRHGWFYKNCYDSGVMECPPGGTPDEETGAVIPNLQLAQEMLDRRETGAGIAYEATPEGMGGWKYIPPTAYEMPEGLFDYGEALRDEKWEGMGVPPEVAKAEQTGSFAGRRVPQQAFYSFLQEIANEQMYDFDEQCLRFIVRLNYGEEVDYEIKPVPIMLTLQQEEMGGITGHLPGDESDPFYSGDSTGGAGSGMVQSGGRIEDRNSNAFNIAEQKFTQSAGR